MGVYDDTDSAPRITLIALTKNSPATRAEGASRPKLHIPTPGTQHDHGIGAAHRRRVGRRVTARSTRRTRSRYCEVQLAQPVRRASRTARPGRGRGTADGPSCGGSDRGTRCPARRGAVPRRWRGTRGRPGRRRSARRAAGRVEASPRTTGASRAASTRARGVGERAIVVDRRSERVSRDRVSREELLGLLDQLERRGLALVARRAPADHAVAAEHRHRRASDACRAKSREREPELEPGAPPGEPPHVVAEALGHEPLTVGGGRQRDHRVGMEVVDVVDVDERVQRRVDRRHRATVAEPARGVARRRCRPRARPQSCSRSSARTRSRSSRARPASVSVPRSPPEPFTASTRVGAPVTGSASVTLADVFPPAKFVTRLSAPSRWERASSSSKATVDRASDMFDILESNKFAHQRDGTSGGLAKRVAIRSSEHSNQPVRALCRCACDDAVASAVVGLARPAGDLGEPESVEREPGCQIWGPSPRSVYRSIAVAPRSGSVQSFPSCMTSAWRMVISVPAGPSTVTSTTPTRFWPKSTIVPPLGDSKTSDGSAAFRDPYRRRAAGRSTW